MCTLGPHLLIILLYARSACELCGLRASLPHGVCLYFVNAYAVAFWWAVQQAGLVLEQPCPRRPCAVGCKTWSQVGNSCVNSQVGVGASGAACCNMQTTRPRPSEHVDLVGPHVNLSIPSSWPHILVVRGPERTPR